MNLDPNEQCSTCAFGKNCGAGLESHNRLKGMICALAGVPFSCHHAPDGRELNWRGSPADFVNSLNGKQDLRICAGWKKEVREAKRRGFFKNGSGTIRRALGQYAMDKMEEFLSRNIDPAEKEEARLELGRTLKMLVKGIIPLSTARE